MCRAGGGYRVENAGFAAVDPGQYNLSPVEAQSAAIREAIRTMPTGSSIFVGGLPGPAVVIRYPRLGDLPDAQLDAAVREEARQNLPFELSEAFLDWTLLERSVEGEVSLARVLLVAARQEMIDTRVQTAAAAEIKYAILSVDALALADAAEVCNFLQTGETVALVNTGAASTNIHFLKNGLSNFYRDVNWNARDLLQAVAKARHCDLAGAEQILRESSQEMSRRQAPPPEPEEFSRKSTGPEEFGGSLFEPFGDEGGPSGPPPATRGTGGEREESIKVIAHTPLARLANEIRRTFDFYEQSLFQDPVDRVILSGGIAHLPSVHETLQEELGFENIEVANPLESALVFGREEGIAPLRRQPAQFMVALGLAARGVAEL